MNGRRTAVRAGAVCVAVVGALLVWGGARLAGVDVRAVRRSGTPTEVDFADVVVFGLVAGLLGWLLLAGLERVTRLAVPVWLAGAVVLLGVALFRSARVEQLDAAQRAVLCLRTFVIAALLAPPLIWSSPRRSWRGESE